MNFMGHPFSTGKRVLGSILACSYRSPQGIVPIPLPWSPRFPESPILADGLFIYGTLREGGAHHAWLQRTQPLGSTRAWAPGRLFHLPEAGYPALVPSAEPEAPPPGLGWVVGEFIGYEDELDLEAALADLDQVEGVEEELFLRITLPVILDGGQRYEAWVYVFPADRLQTLERKATELPEGDWSSYLGNGML